MQQHWIFQLQKDITADKKQHLNEGLQNFLTDWKAHGAPVPGKSEILYDRFVHIEAEPGTTSGCSIDAMDKGVNAVLSGLDLNPLAPNFIFYRNGSSPIQYLDFRAIPDAISSDQLNAETTIFDATMGQSQDFNNWEVKLKDSWLKRYLSKAVQ